MEVAVVSSEAGKEGGGGLGAGGGADAPTIGFGWNDQLAGLKEGDDGTESAKGAVLPNGKGFLFIRGWWVIWSAVWVYIPPFNFQQNTC
jgi:hypothetical protein